MGVSPLEWSSMPGTLYPTTRGPGHQGSDYGVSGWRWLARRWHRGGAGGRRCRDGVAPRGAVVAVGRWEGGAGGRARPCWVGFGVDVATTPLEHEGQRFIQLSVLASVTYQIFTKSNRLLKTALFNR